MGLGSNKAKAASNGRTKLDWRKNTHFQAQVNPMAIDAEQLLIAIARVVQAGACFQLTKTTDGGCYCLTIFDGDDRSKAYPRNEIELGELLGAIADEYGPEGTPLGV